MNFGEIIGLGGKRDGVVYTDAKAEKFSIINELGGVIDVGQDYGTAISIIILANIQAYLAPQHT